MKQYSIQVLMNIVYQSFFVMWLSSGYGYVNDTLVYGFMKNVTLKMKRTFISLYMLSSIKRQSGPENINNE